MQRFKYLFLLWIAIAALAILTMQSTGVEAAVNKQRPPVSPPIPATSVSVTSTLFGIAALSPTSAWAVGTSMNVPQFTGQPLIEQWNGSSWQIVSGPTAPQNEFNSLIGITALANDNAWAVGFSMNTTKTTGQPLIEHWNGSSWQIVPGPTTIKSGSLSAITASGPNDIWAVGSTYSASGTTSEPLILHWNGTTWEVVTGAKTKQNTSLLSVTALSSTDAWAVGSSSSAKSSQAVIEHWDGSSWQIVPGLSSKMSFNELSAVTALSDHNIWAVGNSFSHPLQVHPSIEHWDGKSWSAVTSAGLPASFAPTAISARSADDIWVTGAGNLAHWNGKSWQSSTSTTQKGFNLLNAITILAHDDAWAVGFSVQATSAVTLIEQWNGSSWQVIPSPSLTVKTKPAKNPLKHK